MLKLLTHVRTSGCRGIDLGDQFALGNLAKSDIFRFLVALGLHERAVPGVELPDSLRDNINENRRTGYAALSLF